MAAFCIGIDLGGTFIKAALLDEQLTVRNQQQLPTPIDAGPEAVIKAMARAARAALLEGGVSLADVVGVGIGSPGLLDLPAGVVIGMPNIPGFENVPIRDRLAEMLALPAVLENDANAAALAEYLVGVGRGAKLMILLTLGTGIGGGIVADGKLLHGAHGLAGEIGHIIVAPGGRACGCGQQGCLERYASATYLAQHARLLIEQQGRQSSLAQLLRDKGEFDARDVQVAAGAGDSLAKEVWDEAIRYLAIAAVSLTDVLDPDLIVLGGGMANAGEALLDPLTEHFHREQRKLNAVTPRLAMAQLGNDAGVIGAAGAAWQEFGK